jgi:acetoacetyl-CoA synthetase
MLNSGFHNELQMAVRRSECRARLPELNYKNQRRSLNVKNALHPVLQEGVTEGQLLWYPSATRIENASLTHYIRWLAEKRNLSFDDYDGLWQWSVSDISAFWASIWDFFEVKSSSPYTTVLSTSTMPGAQWFPGARLNFAEHMLRHEREGHDALLYLSEKGPLRGLSWSDFAGKVRRLATALRELNVQPGDRVVAYLPNIPEALIAMCATTAVGAVWSSCSPDFGSRGVLDRVQQLAPKVMFAVDGYYYGGKPFDRRDELRHIVESLDSLEHLVYLPAMFPDSEPPIARAVTWTALLDRPEVPAADFEFEQVPFDHPLWILFSSGTTGLPKAIVHSHGGILLEQFKVQHFHMDLRAGDVAFFYSTTGWMMWNSLISSLISDVRPVLYDGNPAYPSADVLWKMVQDSGASFFGASPTYVDIMKQQGIVPGERYDLSALRSVMPAGSPVSPECTAWFYANLKSDLWIATGSGGTDCCTGLVGGVPTLPVYAGEIQARSLGVAAYAFDEKGVSVVGEVGELVITKPMPSMPVFFWNDPEGERYRESYFDTYQGVWRHGDFFKLNERGGCYVLGRSDATLNRFGIRIGTAEIYRTLVQMEEVVDALIVNLDLPGGHFFMPLFVKLREGLTLDESVEKKIAACLRREYTPRHVPDKIYQVDDIPMTLTGKKMEVPVRRLLMGQALEKAANLSAMRDPNAMNYFVDYVRSQEDYRL